MSRDTILGRGRAVAEAGMTDTCVIRRRTGQTTDDLTGVVTPTYTTIYTGRCRLQLTPVSAGTRTEIGEASAVVVKPVLQLPIVGSEAVSHGDEVTMTAAAHDSALVGRVFTVRDEAPKSQATARRLTVEEVT